MPLSFKQYFLSGDIPADHQSLDFRSSFTYRAKFGIPVEFLYREIFGITVAAEDLNGVV